LHRFVGLIWTFLDPRKKKFLFLGKDFFSLSGKIPILFGQPLFVRHLFKMPFYGMFFSKIVGKININTSLPQHSKEYFDTIEKMDIQEAFSNINLDFQIFYQ
jgi:hypothetical protein